MINALSNQVIFLGDFNSKHKQFVCVKPNKPGQTLVNIAKDLKLFYVNQLSPNRHLREEPVHGTSDILDMTLLSPGLNYRDISFGIADDHIGSDHFPIQISLDIREKRKLRRLYNSTQDPNTKSTINKLRKEIRTKINQESTIRWEKFCNSISRSKKSWRKTTNFLKPKSPRSYPALKLGNKTAKTNPEKAQLFVKIVERDFGIESYLFRKSQFDGINKFVEAHSYHFTPLNSLHDNITDTDDDSDLLADVYPDTRIPIARSELKNEKTPGIDNVYNDILKKAIGTGFYKLGFIPYVWKVAVLCMLIKPDKPPSQTTSYRPISL